MLAGSRHDYVLVLLEESGFLPLDEIFVRTGVTPQAAQDLQSSPEQARLGLNALRPEEFERIAAINRRYREKFGFPCIVALKLHASRDSVLDEMERRVDNPPEQEFGRALEQIGHITRGRLEKWAS